MRPLTALPSDVAYGNHPQARLLLESGSWNFFADVADVADVAGVGVGIGFGVGILPSSLAWTPKRGGSSTGCFGV